MSNLFLILVIAFVLIVFAIALLAIGWLITGKTKIERPCGGDSAKKQDDQCSISRVSSPQQEQGKPSVEKNATKESRSDVS